MNYKKIYIWTVLCYLSYCNSSEILPDKAVVITAMVRTVPGLSRVKIEVPGEKTQDMTFPELQHSAEKLNALLHKYPDMPVVMQAYLCNMRDERDMVARLEWFKEYGATVSAIAKDIPTTRVHSISGELDNFQSIAYSFNKSSGAMSQCTDHAPIDGPRLSVEMYTKSDGQGAGVMLMRLCATMEGRGSTGGLEQEAEFYVVDAESAQQAVGKMYDMVDRWRIVKPVYITIQTALEDRNWEDFINKHKGVFTPQERSLDAENNLTALLSELGIKNVRYSLNRGDFSSEVTRAAFVRHAKEHADKLQREQEGSTETSEARSDNTEKSKQ